jgi:hypothetical protein
MCPMARERAILAHSDAYAFSRAFHELHGVGACCDQPISREPPPLLKQWSDENQRTSKYQRQHVPGDRLKLCDAACDA